ncbi:hypothetical protein QZH41_010204 [Actinostola sp. cb2023]|nr:hypothetical protein QZH41_010204 [Actinostola sp. cb2023]
MSRKAFSCNVDLDLYRVSCPGTLHLPDRNMVFINVCALGQSNRTKSVFATFPLNFNERFVFEQTFTSVSEPSQVVELLEDTFVVLELRQYSEYHKGKYAVFHCVAFLRVYLGFYPDQWFNYQEMLMNELIYNVCENTYSRLLSTMWAKRYLKLNQIKSQPALHCLVLYAGGKLLGRYKQTAKEFLYPSPTLTGKNGMDRELLLSRTVHFTGIDPKLEFASRTTVQEITIPGAACYPITNGYSSDVSENSFSDGSSETEEEVVVHPSIYTSEFSDAHCVCECPRRPENKGMVVNRSRSLSPTRRPKSASPTRQPPFKAGTADQNIISRRHFPHSRTLRQTTPLPAEGDPMPCYDCKVPHKDCIVCQAYYKVFGRDFLKHRFTTNRQTTRASEPPITRSQRYFEQDTGPSYHDRAYSAPIPRTRTRLFSTPKPTSSHYTSPERKDRKYAHVSLFDQHAQAAEQRSYIDLSDSDDDSLLSLQELSVTVPLSNGNYWSNRKSMYTGRPHRDIFNESVQAIYEDLYDNALI